MLIVFLNGALECLTCLQVRRLLAIITASSSTGRKLDKREIHELRRATHALAEIAKQGVKCTSSSCIHIALTCMFPV